MQNRKYRKAILLSSLAIAACAAVMVGTTYALFSQQKDFANVTANNAKINVWTTTRLMSGFSVVNGTQKSLTAQSDGSFKFNNGGTAKLDDKGGVVFTNAVAGDKVLVWVTAKNASEVKTQWKFLFNSDNANVKVTVCYDFTMYHDITERLYYNSADLVAAGSDAATLQGCYVSSEATGAATGTTSFDGNAVFATSIERKVSSLENWESAITSLGGLENQVYTLTDDITLGTKGGTDADAGKELFFTPAEGKETTVVINGNGHKIYLEGDPTGAVRKGDGEINSSGFGFHPRKTAMDGVENTNVEKTIGKTRIVLRNVTLINGKTANNTSEGGWLQPYLGIHAYLDASTIDVLNSTIDGGIFLVGNAYFTYTTFQYSDGLGDPSNRYLCVAMGDLTGSGTYTFYSCNFTGRVVNSTQKLYGMLYVCGQTNDPAKLNLRFQNKFTGASNVLTPSNDVVLGAYTTLTTDKSNIFESSSEITNGVTSISVKECTYNGESWNAARTVKNLETIYNS